MKYKIHPERLEAQAAHAADFFQSLASKHRLMILCRLLEGERSAGDLARLLAMTASNLSQHLAKLRQENLVLTRREGTVIHYRLAAAQVVPVLRLLYRMFCAVGSLAGRRVDISSAGEQVQRRARQKPRKGSAKEKSGNARRLGK